MRTQLNRQSIVFIHRWIGLLSAVFLITVGLTGSLLAFDTQLDRLFNPHLYVMPKSGEKPLDPATLAARVEAQEPKARVAYFGLRVPGQIVVSVHARMDPQTGKP